MKPGLRVVRQPDWSSEDQDGGEGHLGTVVEVSGQNGSTLPDKHVLVQWDAGSRHQYRVGAGDAYDLCVFDNAPAGIRHPAICDECKDVGIEGVRWRCSTCDSHDLCNKCYMSDKHDLTHPFKRHDVGADSVAVPPRSQGQKTRALGIFPGAMVCRGPDWKWGDQDGGEGKQGKVVKDSNTSIGKMIIVQWMNDRRGDNRLGSNGKIDLRCITPADGGYYYKSHLPVLGKDEVADGGQERESFLDMMGGLGSALLKPLIGLEMLGRLAALEDSSIGKSEIRQGFRVVRGPVWKWADQDGGEGHVGTVIDTSQSDVRKRPSVKVVWDSGEKNFYRAGAEEAFDLFLYDSAPAGVKHLNIRCDECQEKPISGIRWKCSDCENYICVPRATTQTNTTQHIPSFPVGKRCDSEKVQVIGIFPGSTVKRGKDWKWKDTDGGEDKEGQVTRIRKWTPETRRSAADVQWPGPSRLPVSHRAGHNGKMDLKCIKPASGGFYYKSHLPAVGKKEKVEQKFKVGDKVNIILDIESVKKLQEDNGGWNDDMIKYMKKVGTIKRTDEYGVVVKYDDDKKWVYNQDVLNPVWLNEDSQQGAVVEPKQGGSKGSHTASNGQKLNPPGNDVDEINEDKAT